LVGSLKLWYLWGTSKAKVTILFIKHSQDGKLTLLLVYVNDIIITGNDELEKQTLRERLAAQFEMKDLGKLKYFLGIEVAYSR